MRVRTVLAAIALTLALAPPASAQDSKAPKPPPATTAGKAATRGEVRRDPAGIKGISPYMEELAKGRRAFAANDHAAAIAAFDAAIGKDGERLLAYLLKAQAQLATGELEAAHATAAVGRTKKGSEAEQSKLLFLSAELDERRANSKPGSDNAPGTLDKLQAKWDAVKDSWSRYLTFVAERSEVPDFKASADDRRAKIDARVKRDKDYSAVKKRIADNEAEREKEAAKDAK